MPVQRVFVRALCSNTSHDSGAWPTRHGNRPEVQKARSRGDTVLCVFHLSRSGNHSSGLSPAMFTDGFSSVFSAVVATLHGAAIFFLRQCAASGTAVLEAPSQVFIGLKGALGFDTTCCGLFLVVLSATGSTTFSVTLAVLESRRTCRTGQHQTSATVALASTVRGRANLLPQRSASIGSQAP